MEYDNETRTLYISHEELIYLMRTGKITNRYLTDTEEIYEVKVED